MRILSWDIGIINLAYCLMEKNGKNYEIIDWDIINLSPKKTYKCCMCKKNANKKVLDFNNNKIIYYCGVHHKKHTSNLPSFNELFNFKTINDQKQKEHYEKNICNKNNCKVQSTYFGKINNEELCFCKNHANKYYDLINKQCNITSLKKEKTIQDIDMLKQKLVVELENRPQLFTAEGVIIENQPGLKNPKMKTIASAVYMYYLIRGIFDRKYNSQICQVKYISPSNKIKLSKEKDIILHADKKEKYKLTKSLSVKYVKEILQTQNSLNKWIEHFSKYIKKDDLADTFLQGAYYLTIVADIGNDK